MDYQDENAATVSRSLNHLLDIPNEAFHRRLTILTQVLLKQWAEFKICSKQFAYRVFWLHVNGQKNTGVICNNC